MPKLLSNLRDRYRRAFQVWPAFEQRAAEDGYTTDDALARLIQRYLARGFDDGQPEQRGSHPTSARTKGTHSS